jgi:hypothetical protein
LITKDTRREFEQIGVDDVKKRVAHSTWSADKLSEAREWLKENDPAWISARAARHSVIAASIALVISFLSLGASVLSLWKGH